MNPPEAFAFGASSFLSSPPSVFFGAPNVNPPEAFAFGASALFASPVLGFGAPNEKPPVDGVDEPPFLRLTNAAGFEGPPAGAPFGFGVSQHAHLASFSLLNTEHPAHFHSPGFGPNLDMSKDPVISEGSGPSLESVFGLFIGTSPISLDCLSGERDELESVAPPDDAGALEDAKSNPPTPASFDEDDAGEDCWPRLLPKGVAPAPRLRLRRA